MKCSREANTRANTGGVFYLSGTTPPPPFRGRLMSRPMTRPVRLRPLLLLVTLSLPGYAAPAAAAQPYQDKTHHFAVDVPAGWEPVPVDELARLQAALGKYFPARTATPAAAFRPAGGGSRPLPAVVVHVDGELSERVPFEQFERQFGRDFEVTRARARQLGRQTRTTMARPAFDRDRKRVTYTASAAREESRVGMYAVYSLGPDRALVLTGYAEADAFRDRMPAFVAMADSARFEAPPTPEYLSSLDRLVGHPLGDVGRMAVVGGVTAAVVLLVGLLGWRVSPVDRRLHA
jgi:hypothetical protein